MAENNNDNKIQTVEVSLGNAKRFDPNAPHEEVFISQAMLNARQEAIGETRKYAGPVSDEKLETLSEEMVSERTNSMETPPTECAEPSDSDATNSLEASPIEDDSEYEESQE